MRHISYKKLTKMLYVFVITAIYSVHASLEKEIISMKGTRVKEAIENVVDRSGVDDIIVLIDTKAKNEHFQHLVEIVSNVVSKRKPAIILANPSETELVSLTMIATSRTLVISIGDHNTTSNTMYELMKTMYSVWHVHYNIKYLGIILTKQQTEQYTFIKYFWDQAQIIDATVLLITLPHFSMILQQFNPFKKSYAYKLYRPYVPWFPDKMRNMQEENFEIVISGTTKARGGTDTKLGKLVPNTFWNLRILEESMNFYMVNKSSIKNTLATSCDLHYPAVPIRADNYHSYDHTVPLLIDDICLIIPKIVLHRKVSIIRTVIVVSVAFLITIIILAFMTLVKVDQRLRRPLDIFSLILGLPVSVRQNTLIEKVLFLLILIVSLQFASMFYTELYDSAIAEEKVLEIKDFEDLEESGLNFSIDSMRYELIREQLTDTLMERMNIINYRPVQYADYLSNLANISMFDNTGHFVQMVDMARVFDVLNKKETQIIKTDLCISQTYFAYVLDKRSAYKNRIDDILLRVREVGLEHSLHNRALEKPKISMQYLEESPSDKIIVYFLFGYLLAVCVFFVEFLVEYVTFRLHSIVYKM